MALYDTRHLSSALSSIPLRSSTADPYRLSRPPSNRYASYAPAPAAAPSYAPPPLRRLTTPSSLSRPSFPPRPLPPPATRAPSPARPSSVVYQTSAPTRSASPVSYGGEKGLGLRRRRSMSGLSAGVAVERAAAYGPTAPQSPVLSYPCSGAAVPSSSPSHSPFLRIAPILNDLPPKLALVLAQLSNSLESLAAQHPLHSPAVQHHPSFAAGFSSWTSALLPLFPSFLDALSQLREASEDVWLAAGGYVAASTEGIVSVGVERPDPEGGSHTITVREVLSPVSAASLERTVGRIRRCAVRLMEVESEVEEVVEKLLGEAERMLSVLGHVERMAAQMEQQFPGGPVPRVSSQQHVKTLLHSIVQLATFPRQLYSLLSALASSPSLLSGAFFHPSQARDVFSAFRRIDSTLSQASTQVENAYRLVVERLGETGYYPQSSRASATSGAGGKQRAQTYPRPGEHVASPAGGGGVGKRPPSRLARRSSVGSCPPSVGYGGYSPGLEGVHVRLGSRGRSSSRMR